MLDKDKEISGEEEDSFRSESAMNVYMERESELEGESRQTVMKDGATYV